MFFAPLLAVVVLVAGLGLGQTMSMMTLSGVAGGQVSVNARKKDKECSPDDTVASLSPSDNMKNLATLLLTDPHHIFMGGYDFKDHPAFLMAILGNVANESGFDPRTRQGRGNGDFEAYTGLSGADDTPPKNDEILPALNRVYNEKKISGGYAIGVMQWDGARAINLVKFAMGDYTAKGRGHIDADPNGTTTAGAKQVYNPFKGHPKQWYDMDVQAAFIRYELMTKYYDTLNSFRESARVDATSSSVAKDHVENLTREFFWKIEFSWPESVYKVYPPTYEAAPKRFGTPEGFKKRVESANKRAADAWSSKKLVDKWAADLHLSLVPLASDPCDVDSGSVEGGSLADFKYDGKITGGYTPINNYADFSKYGWNDNGTFDAKMLPGSDGRIAYFANGYQCTSWVAVRMFSLGLTKRLMDAGITWDTLNHLGNGDEQVGKLHNAGVPMDRKPQVHDVVSYTNMNHVAFVEEVHGNTIVISEGNSYADGVHEPPPAGKVPIPDLRSTSTENMVFAHVEEFLKSKGK